MELNKEQKQQLIDLIKEGKPLPEEFKWLLFEGKQESELCYFGKERDIDILTDTMAVPLLRVKSFGKIKEDEWHNMIIFWDNLQVLKELLKWKEEGKLKNPDGSLGIKLIFIDPPFGTGDIYGTGDVGAYSAKLRGTQYLEWLRKRLILLKEILTNDGSIYVRIDYHFGHYVKVLMDEIFGKENFQSEITLSRFSKPSNRYVTVTESLFYYTISNESLFNKIDRPRSCPFCKQKVEPKWQNMVSPGEGEPKKILGEIRYPPKGQHWKYSQENIDKMQKENRIKLESKITYIDTRGKKSYMVQFLEEEEQYVQSNWTDLPGYRRFHTGYPTENSEEVLERVIRASSNHGDLILDCFAGSGTTGAVAEKLGRRWIMVDAGRLAIYTMIKRMLNLKEGIGNTGKSLTAKPFAVYNAGLYDYKMIKELPFEQYRKFALSLFQCKNEPHEVGKIMLDGYFGLDHVLVFKWKNKEELVIDKDYIDELHSLIGDKIGKKFFIIAPWVNIAFREDVIPKDDVKYYMLRIPYSIIDELHKKQFMPLNQPIYTDQDVNAVMEQIGFDFINPPTVECDYYLDKPKAGLGAFTGEKEAVIKIKKFHSNVITKKPLSEEERGLKALSIVMIDFNYNGEWFNLSKWFSSSDLEKKKYEIRLNPNNFGEKIMIIHIDNYGNEKKEVLTLKDFKRK